MGHTGRQGILRGSGRYACDVPAVYSSTCDTVIRECGLQSLSIRRPCHCSELLWTNVQLMDCIFIQVSLRRRIVRTRLQSVLRVDLCKYRARLVRFEYGQRSTGVKNPPWRDINKSHAEEASCTVWKHAKSP